MRDEKIQMEGTPKFSKGRSASTYVVPDKNKSNSDVSYYTYYSSCSRAPEKLKVSLRGFHLA